VPGLPRTLRIGDRGTDVEAWQKFLRDQGIDPRPIDGIFGPLTDNATVAFQQKHTLGVDGIAGPETYGKAISLGFKAAATPRAPDRKPPRSPPAKTPDDLDYPARPNFDPLVSTQDRERLFHHFAYVPAPRPDEERAIRITDNWERENIVNVPIPQLKNTAIGSRAPATIRFHRLAAAQLQGLWADWEAANLLDRILNYEGAFVARFIGGTTTLSNHAFGGAFDINVPFNPWHSPPAKPGQKGCVYELVPIANRWGFFWGGHYSGKSTDGMHFEVAVLKK
jgi:peptidoglycan hydrolase-like protein with peptidoglycan-binding domain